MQSCFNLSHFFYSLLIPCAIFMFTVDKSIYLSYTAIAKGLLHSLAKTQMLNL